MKNKFRLISEVKVFIQGRDLYIASPDNKGCISKVKSKIPKTEKLIDELQIELEDFSIRLNSQLDIIVSSNNLPGGSKYEYRLANYDRNGLGDLILSKNFDHGKCIDLFEPAINDEDGSIILVSPGMLSYTKASDEMIRRMNCQMLKKTKTFIPGHRYDSVDNTIFYLGKLYSHSVSDLNSDYIKHAPREVHIFTKYIGEAKTVSEILNNGVFFTGDAFSDYYKIDSTENLGLMVDSGEVLVNDFTKYSNYLDNLYKNSIEVNKNSDYSYGLKTIFDIFKLSDDPINSIDDNLRSELEDFLRKDIKRVLYTFWNSDTTYTNSRLDLSLNTPKEELTDRLISRYFSEVLDPNTKKHSYYREMFNDLGINLTDLVDLIFSTWDSTILETDFDIFINYSRGKAYNVRLRTEKSSKYSGHLSVVKLSDLIKNDDLIDCIKDFCSTIRSSYGVGCSLYEKINVGTMTKPLIYENITITSQDIVNYYKEKGLEIPENLKCGILDEKFCQVNINVDLGSEIE